MILLCIQIVSEQCFILCINAKEAVWFMTNMFQNGIADMDRSN